MPLLNSIADHFLSLYPEGATGLGVDTGARTGASLSSWKIDRPQDESRIASVLQNDLARAKAFDTSGLDFQMRTNFDVVRSAYETALEGFSQPYGDVAVGGWRNTPYVVIQNVGACLDVPQLLNSDQPLETKADAEAYLSPAQRNIQRSSTASLSGSSRRAAKAWSRRAFLIDKAHAAADHGGQGSPATAERWSIRLPAEDQGQGDSPAIGQTRARDIVDEADRAGAGAADRRASGPARKRDRRRRHVGPPARRGILPLGAQGRHDDRPSRPDEIHSDGP